MNANFVVIVGRLSMDPILKSFTRKDETVSHRVFMSVAVTRLGDLGAKREDQRTNFVPVVVWGKQAETCAQYLARGTEVTVVGELIAESRVKLDENQQPIVINGVTQRDSFIQVQATSVQFGAKSQKNASAADVATQLAALTARVAELSKDEEAAGEATPAGEAAADTPSTGPDGNPFGDDVGAAAGATA
jgi:single stranded DNA-binding protein